MYGSAKPSFSLSRKRSQRIIADNKHKQTTLPSNDNHTKSSYMASRTGGFQGFDSKSCKRHFILTSLYFSEQGELLT